MLRRLIIIENEEQVQCDTLEELVKILIDENYYSMTQDEKNNKMQIKALANCLGTKRKIVQNMQEEANNLDEVFLIKDEITYILSLLMTNKIVLLERKDANILAKNLNKENIKDNYIIVNTFAKELLNKYIAM